MRTVAFLILMLVNAAITARSGPQTGRRQAAPIGLPTPSAFGAWVAWESYFDGQKSDYLPEELIVGMGGHIVRLDNNAPDNDDIIVLPDSTVSASTQALAEITGRWLLPDSTAPLHLYHTPTEKDPGDETFTIRSGGLSWSFGACYSQLVVYGCDLDGDGIDEVIIEHGRGRGTFVYRRRITVLKRLQNRWHPLFVDWLCGYTGFGAPTTEKTWSRRYHFKTSPSGGYALVLTRNYPEDAENLQDNGVDVVVPLPMKRAVLIFDAKSWSIFTK